MVLILSAVTYINNREATFQVTIKKLYVPIATLSAKDNLFIGMDIKQK